MEKDEQMNWRGLSRPCALRSKSFWEDSHGNLGVFSGALQVKGARVELIH